jgi:hypothetical protein
MKKFLAGLLIYFLALAQADAQIVGALPFQLQNGTTADVTQVMADFDKILNDTNANAAKNGVNTDITALTALVTPITPAQGGTTIYFASTSGGSANAQTVTSPTPTGFTLAVGKRVTFIAGFTNTGAMTLNVNATGVTNVYRYTPLGPAVLTGGEVVAGNYVEVVFDGTQFQLYTNAATPLNGPYTILASASTTDLGTVSSHAVTISGTTTITSFGSRATTVYPNYKLYFTGVLTLTNGSSLVLPGGADIITAVGDSAEALYAGSGNWIVTNYSRKNGQPLAFSANFLQGYINGCILSTAGSSSTMSISACQATDSTNAQVMIGAASSKTTSSWTVGAAGGGLDTGAIATNTWYHFHEMVRPDTGVVDYCISLSASSCTTGGAIPAAYTLFRRIGSGKTNGSSQWTLFFQNGDEFLWSTPVLDVNISNLSTTQLTETLASVPTGVVVDALMNFAIQSTSVGINVYLAPLSVANLAPSSSAAPGASLRTQVASVAIWSGRFTIRTDTAASFGARADASSTSLLCVTLGWIDRRGKQ